MRQSSNKIRPRQTDLRRPDKAVSYRRINKRQKHSRIKTRRHQSNRRKINQNRAAVPKHPVPRMNIPMRRHKNNSLIQTGASISHGVGCHRIHNTRKKSHSPRIINLIRKPLRIRQQLNRRRPKTRTHLVQNRNSRNKRLPIPTSARNRGNKLSAEIANLGVIGHKARNTGSRANRLKRSALDCNGAFIRNLHHNRAAVPTGDTQNIARNRTRQRGPRSIVWDNPRRSKMRPHKRQRRPRHDKHCSRRRQKHTKDTHPGALTKKRVTAKAVTRLLT